MFVTAEIISRSPAHADWQVVYEQSDVTGLAAPLPAGSGVMVDLTGIGPVLGISVMPETDGVSLRGADGRIWRCKAGDTSLSSNGEILPLPIPAVQHGVNVLLSAEAVAELGNLSVTVDRDARRVTFSRSGSASAQSSAGDIIGDGWKPFIIQKPKTVSQPAVTARRLPRTNPPAGRERLNVGLGLGYVQDIDWGMQLTASGRLWGGDTSLWGLMTHSDGSTKLHNSHLMWIDKEGGRGLEAGDLYSEAWGLVRGARYSWNASRDRWPSLGVYLKTDKTDNPETSVAYRDDIRLGSKMRVRVEAASDESCYTSAAYKSDRCEVFGFSRSLPSDLGESKGLYASYRAWPGAYLFYGTHSSTDRLSRESRLETIGLRFPIFKRCNLVLEQTERDYETGSMTSRGAGITMPLAGSVNLYLKYQSNSLDADVFTGRVISLQRDTSSLLASLSLFAGRRVHLDYQQFVETQQGQSRSREQLITSIRLSPRTTLQTISGFPNIADSDHLRLRLDQRLRDDLSLLVEYGSLTPYQSSQDIFGRRGYLIMLRKTWTLQVPARGGEVEGAVSDQTGQPVESVVVKLGRYSTSTNTEGRYSFKSVPPGTYEIALAAESVPADYKAGATSRQVRVARDSSQGVDFCLVPLGCIAGRVYLDRNENGRCDEGEGQPEIAVCAGDQATATGRNGDFAFYNLEPGIYGVRVAVEALDKRYIVNGADRVEVELRPNESVTGIEFRLQTRKKPIIFTTLRAEP